MEKVAVRSAGIDALKGFGVMSFIVWHCYANYYKYSQASSAFFRSVLFATGLFVALSGFVVGYHYYSKLQKGYSVRYLFRRIIIRSLKLSFYVFLAGVAVSVLDSKNYRIGQPLREIFTLFYLDRWDIPFQILFVISIGLLGDFFVLLFLLRFGQSCLLMFGIFFLAVFFGDFLFDGHLPYFWRYLPLSIMGTLLGFIATNYLNRNISTRMVAFFIGVFIVLCVQSILYKESYYYILFKIGPYHVLIMSLIIGLGSLAHSPWCTKRWSPLRISRPLALAGQYSLLAYFTQIIIRVSLFFIKANSLSNDAVIILLALVVTILCGMWILVVNYSRRYKRVNLAYDLFFK
jgi:hypothetical protein